MAVRYVLIILPKFEKSENVSVQVGQLRVGARPALLDRTVRAYVEDPALRVGSGGRKPSASDEDATQIIENY